MSNSERRARPIRAQDAYIAPSPLDKLSSILPSFKSGPSTPPPDAEPKPNTSFFPTRTTSAPEPRASYSWLPSFGSSKAVGAGPAPLSSPSIPEPLRRALQDPTTAAIVAATAAVGGTLGAVVVYRRYWRRLRNADSITSAMLDGRKKLIGVVTRVGDGDGFRFYHTPGLFWRYPLRLRSVPTAAKDLKDETLSIRIAGVDAPELAHFGNPAQPYAKEALEWLTRTVQGKRVKLQLLRKDQYGRIVAIPYLPRLIFRDKPIPLMMLRDGMAVVYTAGGAEFGPWGLEGMKKIEDEAKAARRGLWAAKKLELPGDFKKRMKGEGDEVVTMNPSSPSFWERLGSWFGAKT